MPTTFSGHGEARSVFVTRVPMKIDFPSKEIHLRNTGLNTLWISIDGKVFFDVASGTSWDARIACPEFWLKTTVGTTTAVLLLTA